MSGEQQSPETGQQTETADGLLREWFAQWCLNENMPVKMADALHVRTALYLHEGDPSEQVLRPAGGESRG